MMCASEANLLRQAVAGDHGALGQLLKKHAGPLRRTMNGQIPKRWQSVLSEEDVIQETFADAFRDIGHFDPEGDGSLGGWLSRIAKCNLRDAVRMLEAEKRGGDRRRVETRPDDDSRTALLDLLTATGSTPSRHAADNEACSLLEQSISKLPRDYRMVVRRYDLHGESVARIAEDLQRSTGAVYMLRARAHDWLRELMGSTSDFFADSA